MNERIRNNWLHPNVGVPAEPTRDGQSLLMGCGTQRVDMSAPYEDFAGRLHAALDRARFHTGRERTGALSRRYAVSRETARKWLAGLALPELPRIIELAKDFDANLEWLATGRGALDAPVTKPGAYSVREPEAVYTLRSGDEQQLLRAFRAMPDKKRKLLVEFLLS